MFALGRAGEARVCRWGVLCYRCLVRAFYTLMLLTHVVCLHMTAYLIQLCELYTCSTLARRWQRWLWLPAMQGIYVDNYLSYKIADAAMHQPSFNHKNTLHPHSWKYSVSICHSYVRLCCCVHVTPCGFCVECCNRQACVQCVAGSCTCYS